MDKYVIKRSVSTSAGAKNCNTITVEAEIHTEHPAAVTKKLKISERTERYVPVLDVWYSFTFCQGLYTRRPLIRPIFARVLHLGLYPYHTVTDPNRKN